MHMIDFQVILRQERSIVLPDITTGSDAFHDSFLVFNRCTEEFLPLSPIQLNKSHYMSFWNDQEMSGHETWVTKHDQGVWQIIQYAIGLIIFEFTKATIHLETITNYRAGRLGRRGNLSNQRWKGILMLLMEMAHDILEIGSNDRKARNDSKEGERPT